MKLSRDRIIETALTLVDRDGLEALSMRRLAQELDVWPMAVYRWFQDKDALVAALHEAAAERVQAPPGDGPWRARLEALLLDARASLGTEHPGASDRLADAGVPLLREAGLGARAAQESWDALLGYAVRYAGTGDVRYGLALMLDGLERRAAA